jgi:hypothetical protein
MNIIKLAKKGDIKAVSALINRALNPQNIKASVIDEQDKIIVILESSRKLNQTEIVKFIYKGLSKLNLTNYSTLVISGKLTNQSKIEWQKEVKFNPKSQLPSDSITINSTNIDNNHSSSQFQTFQSSYPHIIPNPNTKGAIIPVSKKPSIPQLDAISKSAKYLQKINYVITFLLWISIAIQTLFIISIIYDIFLANNQVFYTIINVTDTTGIVSSWIEQILYLVYRFWDLLKNIQSSLERLTYLSLIIWVYLLHDTVRKIYKHYPILPWGAVMRFSIPLYNFWGVWDVLSNLSFYLKIQNQEVARKGKKIRKHLPWLYTSIFTYLLVYIIYLIYGSLVQEKNTPINIILYLLVDILFICRSIFYLKIINISFQGVFLQANLFQDEISKISI